MKTYVTQIHILVEADNEDGAFAVANEAAMTAEKVAGALVCGLDETTTLKQVEVDPTSVEPHTLSQLLSPEEVTETWRAAVRGGEMRGRDEWATAMKRAGSI